MKKQDDKVHILHVLPVLIQGGVETVISNIIRHSDPATTCHHLLVLENNHTFENEFKDLPVTIDYLPKMTVREKTQLASQIDIVHAPSRKAAFLATPFAKILNKPLVIGVHASLNDVADNPSTNDKIYSTFEPFIARQSAGIVCCAETVHKDVKNRIKAGNKTHLITNGINPECFSRDIEAAESIKQEAHIPADATVIGLCARYSVMKDIPNFIESAKLLKQRHPDKTLTFLMCGNRMTEDNEALVQQLKEAGIYEQTRLMGVRFDMHKIYSAIDVLALTSSKREALSMTLLEGTACGCYCISTDVGDHRLVMDRTVGACVPIKNPAAIADAIDNYFATDKETQKANQQHARKVIEEYYHVENMASQYNNLFIETVRAKNAQATIKR